MHKNKFVKEYQQPDVIEDQKKILTQMKKRKLYIVKFNENDAIKAKKYPVKCIVEYNKRCSIMVITYN